MLVANGSQDRAPAKSAGNDEFIGRRKVEFGVVQQAERYPVPYHPRTSERLCHPHIILCMNNFRIGNKLFTCLIKVILRNSRSLVVEFRV